MRYSRRTSNRRTVLKSIGGVSTLAITGLAGCVDVGDGTEDGNGEGGRGDGNGMDGDGMDGRGGNGMDGEGRGGDGMDGMGDGDCKDGDCMGDGGDGTGGGAGGGKYEDAETIPGRDYPAVDTWLTETAVGGADDTYDRSIVDLREEGEVMIDVGAPGNGDGFAFGPSAVVISTGTEVLWGWTGEGGRHNVVAAPDAQIGESDHVFSSGQPVSGADNEYTYRFDESGVGLYQCEPHLSLGMKGAVVVV